MARIAFVLGLGNTQACPCRKNKETESRKEQTTFSLLAWSTASPPDDPEPIPVNVTWWTENRH